jgi:hypothetical protein
MGEGIGDDVRGARPVLHREIEAQELAYPVMLRDGGEALVEEVLQTVVVGLDDEAPPPEMRPLVLYRLDEADELALICGLRAVARHHMPAEESDRMALLD